MYSYIFFPSPPQWTLRNHAVLFIYTDMPAVPPSATVYFQHPGIRVFFEADDVLCRGVGEGKVTLGVWGVLANNTAWVGTCCRLRAE